MTENAMSPQSDRDKKPQVPSPCRSLCNLNHRSVCSGCFRTSSEISFWVSMSDEEKLEVIEKARLREEESLTKNN